MAKLEKVLNRDFDQLLELIESGILKGSMTASLEDSSDFREGEARCSVRVFERYSAYGENRVSLSVTLFQVRDREIHLSAITSGGSQAVLFKIDVLHTVGEETFLDKLRDII